ncbi:aldolase/citrate lyase family protein [Dactylosporangium sp. NPDC051484]|uniref:HpcH/HpaI aldolase family protein n=1 Tax=Dactylosporangium sp. NPDC051484 TaxID=3154942 RepID=UPI00344D7168
MGSRLQMRWAAKECAYGAWCVTGSPYIAAVMALAPFDYICLDAQHGFMGYEGVLSCIQAAARTEVTIFVRVPHNDPSWIGKSLDAGADGVIVPMVEDADGAARAVSACRYPPTGNRSFGGLRGYGGGHNNSDALPSAICLVMIESEAGLRNAESICSVAGLDGVYIGPADLSIALGGPPTLASLPGPHADGIEAIRRLCAQHDVVAGIQCSSGEQALGRAGEGFRMVTVCADAPLLEAGLRGEFAKLPIASATAMP